MKTFDLIMSRVMMLVLVLVTPLFSFLAGIIWWGCLILNKDYEVYDAERVMNPYIVRYEEGGLHIGVVFLNKGFYLFTLKKIKRDKAGAIIK